MEKLHDPRYCRTHAFVAELYAATATETNAGDTWNYLAQSWTDLAGIKSRAVEMDAKVHRMMSGRYAG